MSSRTSPKGFGIEQSERESFRVHVVACCDLGPKVKLLSRRKEGCSLCTRLKQIQSDSGGEPLTRAFEQVGTGVEWITNRREGLSWKLEPRLSFDAELEIKLLNLLLEIQCDTRMGLVSHSNFLQSILMT